MAFLKGFEVVLARAKISEPDRRFLIARSGGRCNKCKTEIFIENEFFERARLGDDAHIWAYSDEGPRGRDREAPDDRNLVENLILLCKNCHSEVDQQPIKFSAQVLTDMREAHYAWVNSCLGVTQVAKPKFHYILYLNVPRTDMYAAANSVALPQLNLGVANRIRDLGFNAGRLMAAYTHVLNAEDLYARQLGRDDDLSSVTAGQYCFVEAMGFRTIAIDEDRDPHKAWKAGKSVVYRTFADWTLVCLIDPRWITTSTALVTFQSGRAQLCGVVHVSWIDEEARKVYASPLFLAQPGGPFGAL